MVPFAGRCCSDAQLRQPHGVDELVYRLVVCGSPAILIVVPQFLPIAALVETIQGLVMRLSVGEQIYTPLYVAVCCADGRYLLIQAGF